MPMKPRKATKRSRRSVAKRAGDPIRTAMPKVQRDGPVAIWDGEPRRTSIEHDRIFDEH